MNKKKLEKARNNIDKIDQKIFDLIKKRTEVVKHMLELKKYKNEIVDHQRIKKILRKIRIKSIENKIDPKITKKIWKSMIWAYVDFQRKNYKKK
tara:strand:+ start:1034 stop:1315 length:282 start_codon:yes stop_codon:yes gene_type:complete